MNIKIKNHKERIDYNLQILSSGDFIKNKYKHFFNSEDVIKYLKTIDLKNKTILVKGSNKIGLDKVSDYIRCQFDIK